jgi:hypothetical protein
MGVIFAIATVSAGLRLGLPVALAALGALIGGRAGVLNLVIDRDHHWRDSLGPAYFAADPPP